LLDRATWAPARAERASRKLPCSIESTPASIIAGVTVLEMAQAPLSPGMAVTVEIKTGAQRVITYLLSPLLRFKQESLHER
jgi:hypothetical protein